MDLIEDILNIYNKLQDEESKRIFKSYLNHVFYRNYDLFLEELVDYRQLYRNDSWSRFKSENSCFTPEIVIWGAGQDGIRTYKLLKNLGENVIAFADNDIYKQGKELLDGIKIYSIDDIRNKYPQSIHVLASRKYCDSLYEQLILHGFKHNMIYYPPYRRMIGSTGRQYFDCPGLEPMEGEVFIDGGSYDGMTSVQFAEWCNNSYSQIYAFDPDYKCERRIKENIDKYNMHNVRFIASGMGKYTEELKFSSTGLAGGKIDDAGDEIVNVTSLDDILDGEKATFIKLDIEGSEYVALEGSRKTIEKYHPRLAICIYHKVLDFIEIPKLILSMSKDYKFYIRHYTCCEWETVLYAI